MMPKKVCLPRTCSSENFPQAVEDYKSSLATFSSVLPFSSREVASAHFKLGVVLESVANGRTEALENIEKAIESVEARRSGVVEGEQKECDELLQDLRNKVRTQPVRRMTRR